MTTIRRPQPLGLDPTFGFGDRLGLATPGHLDAVRSHAGPIMPIFAQQSIRELDRTGRTPSDVMSSAVEGLRAGRFMGQWGADADHLKTQEDVNATAGARFVFFTIDPSEHVDQRADEYDHTTLRRQYNKLKHEVEWIDSYVGRTVQIKDGPTIIFDETTIKRAAVKYGRAIGHAVKLAAHIDTVMEKRRRRFEIELSVDETLSPTTSAEHYIIADQCLRADMNLVSLAPRYVGKCEKAIEYRGDLQEFERSLRDHAAIARELGPYKLSLHSGSDKLSLYPIFARVTRGLFHVKTAGTSYLEALRVVVRHDPKLFRRIVEFSRERFEIDRATYDLSVNMSQVPPPATLSNNGDLEQIYLDGDNGRQVMHVTFGSVLMDIALGPSMRDVLVAEPETHRDLVARHLGRHLKALRRGMDASDHEEGCRTND